MTDDTQQQEQQPEPAQRRVWVNVYRKPLIGACGSVYDSRKLADDMAARDRCACIEIEFEEGDGLNGRP